VVGDDHERAGLELGVQRAGGVGDDERAKPQEGERAHGQADLVRGVALVEVEAAGEGQDLAAADLALDQRAGVALHRGAGEAGDVGV